MVAFEIICFLTTNRSALTVRLVHRETQNSICSNCVLYGAKRFGLRRLNLAPLIQQRIH